MESLSVNEVTLVQINQGYELAKQFEQDGKLEQVICQCNEIIKLDPNQGQAYKLMGIAFQKKGQFDQALICYQKAAEIQPSFAEVYVNLGCLYYQISQFEVAESCLKKAIDIDPNLGMAHYNLGRVWSQQGRWNQAILGYREVIRLEPNFALGYYQLGVAYHQQGNFEESVTHLKKAVVLEPNLELIRKSLWTALVNWGVNLQGQNQVDPAIRCFQEALEIEDSDAIRLRLLTILPRIYKSLYDLQQWRRHLVNYLDELSQKSLKISDPFQDVNQTLFLLEYQGYNDKNIAENVAKLYRPFLPENLINSGQKSNSGKIKIGFLSCYFYCHSVALCYGRLIHKLPRDQFEVVVLDGPRNHRDHVTEWIHQTADILVQLPANLDTSRDLILQQNLDILVYTDIGTDGFTYFLAMTRLAPVQCVLTGIPVTTGISTIDYYISSALMEPENAQDHYTETLIQLTGLPMDYEKPAPPPNLKSRQQLGLSSQSHLYVCPMTIVKFHPDFDMAMAEILRQDTQGEIILFQYWQTHWHQQLITRFQHTLPDVINRVRFLPWMSPANFMNLLKVADVVLDTFHFSGLNTALMTLAMGTPMVTLPSAYLRGRFSYGLYRRLGILDCVASTPENYVKIACELGTDPGRRHQIQQKILNHHDILYNNNECLEEMIQFFHQVVEKN